MRRSWFSPLCPGLAWEDLVGVSAGAGGVRMKEPEPAGLAFFPSEGLCFPGPRPGPQAQPC